MNFRIELPDHGITVQSDSLSIIPDKSLDIHRISDDLVLTPLYSVQIALPDICFPADRIQIHLILFPLRL